MQANNTFLLYTIFVVADASFSHKFTPKISCRVLTLTIATDDNRFSALTILIILINLLNYFCNKKLHKRCLPGS